MKKRFNNHYFILRHGQTTQQVKRKDFIYNWPDKPPIKLTRKGINQIKKAAKKLKSQKIDLIYSSDIYRTRQTAGIVAKKLGIRVNFDKRLRDINLAFITEALKKIFIRISSYQLRDFLKDLKEERVGMTWRRDCLIS